MVVCTAVLLVLVQPSDLFGLPHLQHRHSSNYGVGIFLCCGIYRVIGTDDQG